jgi:hypothetical protein
MALREREYGGSADLLYLRAEARHGTFHPLAVG